MNGVVVAICLVWTYLLVSILKPLPPFRRRSRSVVAFVAFTIVGFFVIGVLEMQRIEGLKTSDPAAYAKIIAERETSAARAAEERQLATGRDEEKRRQQDDQRQQEREKARLAEEETSRKEACRLDFRQCKSQEQMIADYKGMMEARLDCRRAAKEASRFGEPDLPWPNAFSSFFAIENSPRSGRVSLIEGGGRVPNMYGAMQKARLKCVYDLASKRVIEVTSSPL